MYSCPKCQYKCDNLVSIRRHMMSEIGYRPWHCQHCDFKDIQAGGVKRHCLVKHKVANGFGVQETDYGKEEELALMIEMAKVTMG